MLVVVVGSGCTPVTVERVDQRVVYRDLASTALSRDRLSEATRNVLRRSDLLARFDIDPQGAISALRARFVAGDGGMAELFALAEMSYLHAREAADRSYYLAAAVYAYAYLFPDPLRARPNPYDPQFRQACDLYNLSLAKAFASPDGSRLLLQAGPQTLPFGTLDIAEDTASLRWGGRQLVDFVPAAELQVDGMQNVYRHPGLGAPLAAGTLPLAAESGIRVAPRIKVPATVLLLIPDARAQLAGDHLHASLTVQTIFDATSMQIEGQLVPLEYDHTATLALGLTEADVWSRGISGFLSGNLFANSSDTLVALEPHVAGRIPVVLVHGTASSAGTWADMLNDLLEDPVISAHFEFWFFSYATGNPIPLSALLLREQLQQAVDKLGGDVTDPGLRQMVLIGHSQGGLIIKMLAIDPGTRLWDGLSRVPLEDMKVSATTRELLRRMMFVRPLPQVRRVIFISTPQHGSFVAGFSISRLAGRLVTLPGQVSQGTAEILRGNKDALAFAPPAGGFGSVYGMSPGSPLIRTLAPIPVAPGIAANSIISVLGSGPVEKADDGVVAYSSAHIEGVESELVVHSGHSTLSTAQTIGEVRRLLLRHLAAACPQLSDCPIPTSVSSLAVR